MRSVLLAKMAIQKKSVLITGCSKGGVGDALARAFHRKGLRVFATARYVPFLRLLELTLSHLLGCLALNTSCYRDFMFPLQTPGV